MTDNLDQELRLAIDLARQAGATILEHYRRQVKVEYKLKQEPVTIADRAADALIGAGLRRAFPHDGLLSEESEDDRTRLHKERVWIVDPLDGTREFIEETDDFCVQIALTVAGRPVMGVVYQPVGNLLYHAARGQGAFEVQDGQRRALRVSQEQDPSRMCLAVSRAHYGRTIDAARRRLGIDRVQRLGSVGLKVGLLAAGACDLYLAGNVCKEWDVCAPHALLLEAGGVLTNLKGEVPTYNRPEIGECWGLVASNGRAHQEIVRICTPVLETMKKRKGA